MCESSTLNGAQLYVKYELMPYIGTYKNALAIGIVGHSLLT